MMKALPAFALLIALLLPPFITLAQEEPMPFIPDPNEPIEGEVGEQLPSCFDHYRFGSAAVVLGSELTSAAQGGTIEFTGTLTNENDYPLSDIDVHIKIFHRKNPGVKDSFGPDVVDWMVVEEGLTLRAGEVVPLSFSWNVPKDALPGEYQAASFVASHDRFNMLGLSFATDVIGGSYKFKVVGEDRGATRFDITQSTIGGFVHHSAAFSPRMEFSEQGLPLSMTVVNTSGAPFKGQVTWKLYSWDSLNEANLIETKQEAIDIVQGDSLTLPYVVTDAAHTVYYLLGELIPEDAGASKSYAAIRFVTDAVTEPRLNFVGATGYPISKDTTIFACAHSTGMTSADNVRVEVSAYSNNLLERLMDGGAFASASYEGVMPGMISSVQTEAGKERSSFTIEAKLYQDGKLLDEVKVPYSCSDLGESCETDWVGAVVGVVILILLILLGMRFLKKKPAGAPQVPANS